MTAKMQKYRYLAATLVFALVIFGAIYGVFSVDSSTNKMILEYVENLGWQVNPSPTDITHLTIPQQFDAVFETYNAVQKKSGFDLGNFRGKRVTRYTYELQNHIHSADCRVFLGIIVYENRIIAGEISSTDSTGFMHGIEDIQNIKP
jgi:hypothetical protein